MPPAFGLKDAYKDLDRLQKTSIKNDQDAVKALNRLTNAQVAFEKAANRGGRGRNAPLPVAQQFGVTQASKALYAAQEDLAKRATTIAQKQAREAVEVRAKVEEEAYKEDHRRRRAAVAESLKIEESAYAEERRRASAARDRLARDHEQAIYDEHKRIRAAIDARGKVEESAYAENRRRAQQARERLARDQDAAIAEDARRARQAAADLAAEKPARDRVATARQATRLLDAQVRLGLDEGEYNRRIAAIRAELAQIDATTVTVEAKADVASALVALQTLEAAKDRIKKPTEFEVRSERVSAEIAKIRQQIELMDVSVQIDPKVNTAEFQAQRALLVAQLKDLANEDVDLKVKLDALKALAQLEAIEARVKRTQSRGELAANSFRAFSGVMLGVALLGPLVVPALAGIAGGLAAIGGLATAAGAGLGVTILGFSGVGSALGALNDVQRDAAADAITAARTMATAGRAVEDAQRGVERAEEARTKSVETAAARIKEARKAETDANEAAAERVVSARNDVADAERNAERAALQSTRSVRDARRDLVAAEGAIVDAQRESLRAQQDLNDARADAADQLEDMAFATEAGALREKRAQRAFEAATERLANPQEGDNAEENRLNYDEASLDLRQVRVENQRLREEQAQAVKEGVEGTDTMQSARQRLAGAEQGVTTAMEQQQAAVERLADAVQARTDQEASSTQARTAAASALAAAEAAQVQTTIDGEAAVSEARAAADAAQVAGDRSVEDSLRSLADAQRSYAEAATDIAQGSSAMQKFREEMGQISPAGRDFVYFLDSLQPRFLALRATAQAGLLPGVQEAITTILGQYGPGLEDFIGSISSLLGDLFVQAGEIFTSPMWQRFFEIFAAYAPTFLQQLFDIGFNLLGVFGNLLAVFAPFSAEFGAALVDLTAQFLEWSDSLFSSDGFNKFVDYLMLIGPDLLDFFGALVLAMVNLGVALAPYADVLLQIFTGILLFIAGMDPKTLGTIAVGIITLIVAFQTIFGIISSVSALAGVVGFIFASISGLFGAAALTGALQVAGIIAGIVGAIILLAGAFYLAYQNSETFRNFVDTAFAKLQDAAAAVGEWFMTELVPVFSDIWNDIVAGAQWAFENILIPLFEHIKSIWEFFWPAIAYVWEQIGAPIFNNIGEVLSFVWEYILKPIFGLIGMAFAALVDAISFLWETILKPVFGFIGEVLKILWEDLIRPILGFIINRFKDLAENTREQGNIIDGVLASLGDAWDWLWEKAIKPAIDFIEGGIAGLVSVFENLGEVVGGIMDGISSVLGTSVRFVIDTVINDGLIKGFNGLMKLLEIDFQIADVPVPKFAQAPKALPKGGRSGASKGPSEFYAGGWTGPGTKFQPAGVVHADEFVIKKESRGRLEQQMPGLLDFMNRFGSLPGVGGYATGGRVALRRPVQGPTSSPWGMRGSGMHRGIDWAVPTGTPVRAAADGIAEIVGYQSSWGNRVKVNHGGGLATQVAHLSRFGVKQGQVVNMGDLLGLSGNTGNSTGPHVHFEVYVGGTRVNPASYLSGAAASGGGVGDFLSGVAGGVGSVFGGSRAGLQSILGSFASPVEYLLDKVNFGEVSDSGFGKIAHGLVGFAAKKASEKIYSLVDAVTDFTDGASDGGGGGGGNGGSGVAQWRDEVQRALGILGLPLSLTDTTLRRMNQESGGNARAINNWDINARNGIPSKGLMQVIDPTFRANALPGYNTNIYDPMSNILASMRYALGRYGSLPKAYDKKGGYSEGGQVEGMADNGTMLYDQGGYLAPGLTTVLNLTGKPEPVYTHSQYLEMVGGGGQVPSSFRIDGNVTVDGLPARMEGIAYGVYADMADQAADASTYSVGG